MAIQIYILDCGKRVDYMFPPESKREVLVYTNGEPYIKITIDENIYIRMDDSTKIFFNNNNSNQSGITRIDTREGIQSICDAIGVETIFYNKEGKQE